MHHSPHHHSGGGVHLGSPSHISSHHYNLPSHHLPTQHHGNHLGSSSGLFTSTSRKSAQAYIPTNNTNAPNPLTNNDFILRHKLKPELELGEIVLLKVISYDYRFLIS